MPNPTHRRSARTFPARWRRMRRRRPHKRMPTRLETYLKSRHVKPAHLAKEAGYSRQHILRVRMGRMEPTRRCMAAIVVAIRRLTNEPVCATDLFDLGEDGK
jgi:plasmid stabilization system protein ParE